MLVVACFAANVEWQVLVLDHVSQLPPHREREEYAEVDDQDRRIYWDVEEARKSFVLAVTYFRPHHQLTGIGSRPSSLQSLSLQKAKTGILATA